MTAIEIKVDKETAKKHAEKMSRMKYVAIAACVAFGISAAYGLFYSLILGGIYGLFSMLGWTISAFLIATLYRVEQDRTDKTFVLSRAVKKIQELSENRPDPVKSMGSIGDIMGLLGEINEDDIMDTSEMSTEETLKH